MYIIYDIYDILVCIHVYIYIYLARDGMRRCGGARRVEALEAVSIYLSS